MLTRKLYSLIKTQRLIQTRYPAFFSKEENNYGIRFDEEQIKRKMKEIKERKDDKEKKSKEPRFDFMELNKGS